MAAGLQAAISLSASTWTQIAAGADSGNVQALTVSLCNTNSSLSNVYLATTTTGNTTPANTDYLEFNMGLNGRGVLERTGILLANGQNLIAWASTTGINAVAMAMEGVQTGGTSGIETRADLSASTWTQVIASPSAGRIKACTVNFCNRTAAAINIRLAIAAAPTSPAAGDYLEFDYSLPANGGVLERTGIVIGNGRGIGAWAASAGVTCIAWDADDTST